MIRSARTTVPATCPVETSDAVRSGRAGLAVPYFGMPTSPVGGIRIGSGDSTGPSPMPGPLPPIPGPDG